VRFVRFEPEAQDEFDAAVDWYAARNEFVALRFIDAVQEAVETVQENPEAWPNAPQVAPDLGVRRHLLRKFPYALVYMLIGDEVRVLALAHGRRRPLYWKERAGR
jgi:plasmid stabilization system protein ParE